MKIFHPLFLSLKSVEAWASDFVHREPTDTISFVAVLHDFIILWYGKIDKIKMFVFTFGNNIPLYTIRSYLTIVLRWKSVANQGNMQTSFLKYLSDG